ncbi:MAG: hypothetical protein Ct9H300mP18_10860 [Candidatus Neomarinimicrobiota bacterium]|nr:MAG: hypothetical protein Ct9H300mP18_10860 [Candidatus Neomarinimicrobiota bacterium]
MVYPMRLKTTGITMGWYKMYEFFLERGFAISSMMYGQFGVKEQNSRLNGSHVIIIFLHIPHIIFFIRKFYPTFWESKNEIPIITILSTVLLFSVSNVLQGQGFLKRMKAEQKKTADKEKARLDVNASFFELLQNKQYPVATSLSDAFKSNY